VKSKIHQQRTNGKRRRNQAVDRKRKRKRVRQQLADRKSKNQRRLDKTKLGDDSGTVFRASNIRYEVAECVHGLSFGGSGVFHVLARQLGLIGAIEQRLHVLKIHLPYHESDHVLNIAYNSLCNADCLQDLELRRNDVNYLDALGARRIPDPTTAGDFCRRFNQAHINVLQDVYDDLRIGVWQQQPAEFFDEARLDVDGTLVPTTGECKEDVDIAYNGVWGYHLAGETSRRETMAAGLGVQGFP